MSHSENSNMSQAALELMATLMETSQKQTQHLTNEIMMGYRDDYHRAQATLECVRSRVTHLFAGDFMPTPTAVIRALHPSEDDIKEWMEFLFPHTDNE